MGVERRINLQLRCQVKLNNRPSLQNHLGKIIANVRECDGDGFSATKYNQDTRFNDETLPG
jgi:hypothetical protein